MRPLFLSLPLTLTLSLSAAGQKKADFTWEKAIDSGNQVSVHNITGNISVTASTDGKVHVLGFKTGNSKYFDRVHAEVVQTGRGLVICAVDDDADETCDSRGLESHSHGNHYWDRVGMDLEVSVPAGLDVKASSVSGDVAMAGVQGRDVSAHTVSGDVRLARIRAANVSGHSVSGEINAEIESFTGRGDLSFHTVSGGVTLDLPKTLDVDLSVSTVSGKIDSDYAMTLKSSRMSRRHIDARIGNGGRDLQINTVSGDIRLKAGK
jgi:DUF4097 and DUF4098 domain-containing protein YvlB